MANNGSSVLQYIDLDQMASKVKAWSEDLKAMGISPKELDEINKLLSQNRVGEAYLRIGVLKTIAEELKPDALGRHLLEITRRGEHCLFDLLEISRHLGDIMLWRHYLQDGFTNFESFCAATLKTTPETVAAIENIRNSHSLIPGEMKASDVLTALIHVATAIAKNER